MSKKNSNQQMVELSSSSKTTTRDIIRNAFESIYIPGNQRQPNRSTAGEEVLRSM